ncbi:hypothetical protein [Corynebacterium confusum]|uniref:hypothetical protein n=1 Tax=Corynebacterium confusum TaxID=71254 RepID=UPI0025B3F3E8|nr:hypothetical protein [Corynebacterium confusum]WJY89851.1 hypothetical protein CCONF_06610 [Corynebacterium confusum]
MKLFSRKSLVAGATAIAVSFAGVNVATANEGTQEQSVGAGAEAGNQTGGDQEDQTGGDDENKNKNPEKTSKEVAEEVKAWIGVATAIIGVLGSLFAFFSKYIDIPGLK